MEDFLQVADYYNIEDTSGKRRVGIFFFFTFFGHLADILSRQNIYREIFQLERSDGPIWKSGKNRKKCERSVSWLVKQTGIGWWIRQTAVAPSREPSTYDQSYFLENRGKAFRSESMRWHTATNTNKTIESSTTTTGLDTLHVESKAGETVLCGTFSFSFSFSFCFLSGDELSHRRFNRETNNHAYGLKP